MLCSQTSMINLALTYRNQGRWTEAEELEVQVMETRKRVLGAEHPDTLISMANLASTQWNQGRWTEAEKLEVQVMETSSRVSRTVDGGGRAGGASNESKFKSAACLNALLPALSFSFPSLAPPALSPLSTVLDSYTSMPGWPCWSACLNALLPALSFSFPLLAPPAFPPPSTVLDSIVLMSGWPCWSA